MSRKEKQYHIIYETECLVNGKKYLGMHSTNNLNDDYLGSGKLINRAIIKHGRENFKRTILEVYTTFNEMVAREKEIITEDIVNSPNYYNIMLGGYGGKQTGIVADKISRVVQFHWDNMSDSDKKARMKKVHDAYSSSRRREAALGENNGMYGKTHTNETKRKISEGSKNKDTRIHVFQHKDGNIFEGTLVDFYTTHNLCRAWTSRVVRGIKKSIKGWTYNGTKEA